MVPLLKCVSALSGHVVYRGPWPNHTWCERRQTQRTLKQRDTKNAREASTPSPSESTAISPFPRESGIIKTGGSSFLQTASSVASGTTDAVSAAASGATASSITATATIATAVTATARVLSDPDILSEIARHLGNFLIDLWDFAGVNRVWNAVGADTILRVPAIKFWLQYKRLNQVRRNPESLGRKLPHSIWRLEEQQLRAKMVEKLRKT